MQSYLNQQVGFQVPVHIIRLILKERLKFSRKRNPRRVVNIDMKRIRLLKILYSIGFSRCLSHLNLLVNIDESSFSKNTWNYYGWSKIGEESISKGILFKGSVSVISSITSAGHSYTETVVGALNSKKLSEYLDRLLKYFSDDLNINTSKIGLILDNWSIHRSREINDYFANHDINTIFIPPYCPEFAPIELLFSLVKKFLMKMMVLI